MPPLSEKKKASNAKWDAANLKRMSLAMPLDMFNKMQDHIKGTGETANGFIKRAISETMNRETSVNTLNKCASFVDVSPAVKDLADWMDDRVDGLGLSGIHNRKERKPEEEGW